MAPLKAGATYAARRSLSSVCIGPVHSALWSKMAGEDIKRGVHLQGVMRPLGIEPGEPFKELQVELGQIVEQQRFVYVEELLLHGAVEALAVRVHLRGPREGVPVHDALSLQGAVEVFAE